MLPSPRPGLYLHIPFCSRVCPYCDFAVQVAGPRRRAAFVEALVTEIRLWSGAPELEGWSFDTVYLGGGTPSSLPPEVLAEILDTLWRHLPVAAGAWTLFEANPEDVSRERAAAWRRLGVRTLSLGVQSFDAAGLRFLGRRHDPAAARRSMEVAREAGFDTVSVDLIYGLPGQTPEAWRRDLETAVALAPDHLSCYQLTVHGGTWFGRLAERGELSQLPEPEQAELFGLTHRLLADAGYPAYEVSNFARSPEHRSRHNPKYWHHVPYLGLGPSAHSFGGLIRSRGGAGPLTGRRWWNERTLTRYMERLEEGERPVADFEVLQAAELALEALALTLRTPEGLDTAMFRERFGAEPAGGDSAAVGRLVDAGFLEIDGSWLRPTLPGLAVADALTAELAPV